MRARLRETARRLRDLLSSIRVRLALWFVVMLAVVLAVFSTFIYVSQYRDLRYDAVQEMQSKFERVQSYFQSDAWQNSDISPAQAPDTNGQALLQNGDFIVLATTDGQVVQDWGATLHNDGQVLHALLSSAPPSRSLNIYQQTLSVTKQDGKAASGDYLLILAPIFRHDALLGFLVLGSPSPLNAELQRLRISLIVGSLGMLVMAFLAGFWLADRAMRPVKSIARTAQTISESDLSRRLNLQGHDELAQLGATFDGMLARLQTAFERQRRFVADASHELRTPLTIINLEVGRALSANRKAAEYQRALQVVDLESARMTRLVNDLMMLARMDAGQTILRREDLDLSDIAVEAYERMLPLAQQRQVSVDLGELSELPVNGDPQYLLQMISNLIENAIKYSDPGGRVRIEAEPANANEQAVALLRVSDTGPGIPAEHIPHLFERFYRVDAARARDAQEDASSPAGTGLGLSIVAWIVESHGGHIAVSSEMGKGSTFDVTLPLLHG